jgi:hypothetical protein
VTKVFEQNLDKNVQMPDGQQLRVVDVLAGWRGGKEKEGLDNNNRSQKKAE